MVLICFCFDMQANRSPVLVLLPKKQCSTWPGHVICPYKVRTVQSDLYSGFTLGTNIPERGNNALENSLTQLAFFSKNVLRF